jgi:hypothetical protein
MKAYIKQVTWQEARKEVKQVNPELADLIDDIDPGSEYTLYKACYPYGYESVKNGRFCWPDKDGNPFPLADSDVSNKIKEDLLYNLGSNPVTLVLSGTLEIFLTLDSYIIPAGMIAGKNLFSTGLVLEQGINNQPAFLWNISAGARSLFMLRKIATTKKYKLLKKIFGVDLQVPKKWLDQGKMFAALANSPKFGSEWYAEVLYFGKKWTLQIQSSAPCWLDCIHSKIPPMQVQIFRLVNFYQ